MERNDSTGVHALQNSDPASKTRARTTSHDERRTYDKRKSIDFLTDMSSSHVADNWQPPSEKQVQYRRVSSLRSSPKAASVSANASTSAGGGDTTTSGAGENLSQDPYASLPATDKAWWNSSANGSKSGSACSTGSSSVSESPVRMNRGRVPSYLREGRGRVEQISRGVISIEHAWKNNRRDTHSIRSYYEGMKEQQEAAGSRSRGLSNMSNVVLGDDRIHWDKSFSQEAFKLDAVRARSVKRHANFSEKTERQRYLDYKDANEIVGEPVINAMEQLMRDKLNQRTVAGPFQIRKTFKYFDRDGSGGIDLDEFSDALGQLGFQFADVQIMALFGRYDQDRAGVVNYHEFVDKLMEVDFYDVTQGEAGRRFSNALNSKDDKGLTMKLVDKLRADEHDRRRSMAVGLSQFAEKALAEARKVFNMIDKDGTGSIELQELNLLLLALGKTMPHDELVAAQRSLDLDGSGTVDFEEFMVWYGSLN